jgi:hypothetical protein
LLHRFLRIALLASLAVLLPAAPMLHAQQTPAEVKQLAKLEKKLAKQQLKLAATQLTLDDVAAQLAEAEAQLAAALLLPTGTPEELAAAEKATKLAQKLVTKLGKKVVKWTAKLAKAELKLQGIMAAIELLVPGYFDSDPSGDGGGDDGGDGGGDGGGDPGAGGGDPGGGLDPALALPLMAVDCGDLNGYDATEPGYALLTESVAPPGVSLLPAPLDTVHVAHFFEVAGTVAFPSSVVALDPDQVGERRKLTALVLADPTTLTLSGLPPSTEVSVLLELGATAPWVEFVNGAWTGLSSSTHGLRVERDGPAAGAQWETVARDLRCVTSLNATSFANDSGAILPLRVLGVTDASGSLALRLSSDADTPVLLAAFRVWQRERLPIVYRRTGSAPLQGSDPDAAGFVAAFNAGDLDGAQLLAQALDDPLLRGVALLHVAGWLDGSRDGRLALLPAARAALVEASAAGHALASELVDQLDHVQRALDHFAARGYAHSKLCPDAGGPGFLNPACAGQIYTKIGQGDSNVNFHIGLRELRGVVAGGLGPNALSDLAAWNAGLLDATEYEPSPLVFAALKLTGAALTAMNPLLGVDEDAPESVATLQAARDVFGDFIDLGFAAADFPHDHELELFRAYVDTAQHPKDWSAAQLDLFSASEFADAWWAGQVSALPDEAAAPAWADAQRDLQRTLSAFVGEWMELRLQQGELGGGLGDDVELLLQLFPVLATRRNGPERLLASRLDDLLHHDLTASGAVEDGYWSGALADVEHTSEYGADPLLATRGVFGDTAASALLGGVNGRHVLAATDAATDFAAVNGAGRTRFRSYWFTTDGPDSDPGHALDVFLNGRALAPAVALAGRGSLGSSHALVADLRAWATGWRDDALLSPGAASGKPLGFPAAAQWPSGQQGSGGYWYTHKGIAGDDSQWTSGEVAYVFGLLSTAYRQSSAADRWQFLLPAVRVFRAVAAWEDAGQPAGAAGSEAWAAAELRGGARFGLLVLDHIADFAADSTLMTATDPVLGSTTYVDAALLSRMEGWVETAYTDQGPVLRYALGDVSACTGHSAKNPGAVTMVYEDALDYFRTAWPLLARHAMHTDRIFANVYGVQRELLAAWTGAPLLEGQPFRPLLRWAGADLDLAVLVNHRDAAGTTVSAFVHNFDASAAAVTLTLDEGLQPGSWLVEQGPASQDCDVFGSGVTGSSLLSKRGRSARVSLSLPPGLSLVRLTRAGALAAAERYDLVLDPPRLVAAGSGYAVQVRVANAGLAAAPASSVELYLAAVDASGALVAPAALPSEQLLGTTGLVLGGATGFELPQQVASFSLPAGSPLVALLQSGLGLACRARVVSGDAEWDPGNNEQSRCWHLADLADD